MSNGDVCAAVEQTCSGCLPSSSGAHRRCTARTTCAFNGEMMESGEPPTTRTEGRSKQPIAETLSL